MMALGFYVVYQWQWHLSCRGGFFGDAWSKSRSVAILSCGTGDILCFICLMDTDLRSDMSKGNLYFFKVKNSVQFLLIFSVTVTGSGVSLTQGCVCEWHIYKSKHAAQRNLKKCEKRYCDGCSGSYPTFSTIPEHKLRSLLWNTWVFWTYGFQY